MTFPYRLSAVLMGIAIAIVEFQQVLALPSQQVREIAKEYTVMIAGPDGLGSGVIVGKNGNTYTVLTAYHVIEEPGAYAIETVDGQQYEILRSTRLSPNVDLAVLQFDSKREYVVAKKGNSNQPEGATIYIAGYPRPEKRGQPRTYNFVAAIVKEPDPDPQEGYKLRYGGQAFKGMSGGPVVDSDGLLIGIHGRAETRVVETDIEESVGTRGVPIETFARLQDKIAQGSDSSPQPTPTPTPTTPTPTLKPTPTSIATPTPSPSPSVEPPISASPSPTPQIEVSTRNIPASPAESALSKMLQGQATYFKSTGNFTDKPKLLEQTFKIQPPSDYDFPILSNSAARGVIVYAQPRNPNMRTYVGGVFLEQNADKNNPVTVSIICQTIEPIRSRPPYPTYLEGRLSCGTGTELRSASNLPQNDSQSSQSQATISPQLGANFNLVNFCTAYDYRSSQQSQALEWLQSQISQETLLVFADKWRSRLIDKGRGQINLTDACRYFDRTGKHPHQNQALEWLQQQVSQEKLDDFARRWQNQAAGG